MYTNHTISDLIPLNFVYPYDTNISIKSTLMTYKNGLKGYTSPLFSNLKDVVFNKSTMLVLTPPVKLSDIFVLPTTQLSVGTLDLKAALTVITAPTSSFTATSKYVQVDPTDYTLHASADRMGYYTFLRFKPEDNNMISVWFEGKVLTVSRLFPYTLTFDSKLDTDRYDQQKFDFYVHDEVLRLRSRVVTSGRRLQIYVAPSTDNSNELRLIGDETHHYDFKITSPTQGQQNVKTNFNGNTFWIKYFNDYVDQENNKSVEINTATSISGIPINLLCSSPYETMTVSTSATQPIGDGPTFTVDTIALAINLNILKNFQTPEYEYTDNTFYINQYQIYGQIKTSTGTPLTGVPVSGFPLPLIRNDDGVPKGGTTDVPPSSGVPLPIITNTKDVTTDKEGYYYTLVPYNWTGSAVPVLPDYDTNPTIASFTNVQQDYQQDFIVDVKSYTISGTVINGLSTPLSNINIFTDTDSITATTNLSGIYSFNVPYNWSGVLSPSASYVATFDPVSALIVNVENNIEQDWTQTSP